MSITKKKLKEIPEIDRPREKLIRNGAFALNNTELLAVIIGRGMEGKDVLEIARNINDRYQDNPKHLTLDDLMKIDGVGMSKACQVLAAFELGRRNSETKEVKITTPVDILPFIKDIIHEKQEHFDCIALNGANEVINRRTITIGLLNSNQIHPREVFAEAIKDRAAGVILVHNHPSGDLTPSEEDISITHRLISAGDLLGIKVLDHIIVSNRGFVSLAEKDLIPVSINEKKNKV